MKRLWINFQAGFYKLMIRLKGELSTGWRRMLKFVTGLTIFGFIPEILEVGNVLFSDLLGLTNALGQFRGELPQWLVNALETLRLIAFGATMVIPFITKYSSMFIKMKVEAFKDMKKHGVTENEIIAYKVKGLEWANSNSDPVDLSVYEISKPLRADTQGNYTKAIFKKKDYEQREENSGAR